ncbi:Lysosomal Cystine Transporter (LCT) Family [Micractinium conductrix]|uniref:Lysosomal Cystine Transporter (LCT) Family n=1 Tax=Micractinium conductrix TaxID=554055 RepID=A0A2P6VC98_9CHLO|nr:Lysosomal Cystine Transporter (LCT) Family [Micractinium conductrix]|eukprot:PSC71717.1 Lysosomal Cystine Transporter (LCT) Family [Micractinium conductrix]
MSTEALLPKGHQDSQYVVLTLAAKPSRRRRAFGALFWLGSPLLLGVGLGLLLPTCDHCGLPTPYDRISAVIGWTYFCAWSVSFYPQALSNWRRKSVAGLSLDFQLLNLLGFSCYAVYNAGLFWSPVVRHEYACLNGGAAPAIHANDVFFAVHAAVVTAVTLLQCCMYDRGGQRVSWPAALGAGGAAAAAAAYLAALAVSLVKYIPQVVLNCRRQSTAGWNFYNVLLDFGGGLLSLVQQLLDGYLTQNWSAITGNPVKFGLGFTSMFFDCIFMAQHWCLYPAGGLQAAKEWAEGSEEEGEEEDAAAAGWAPALPSSEANLVAAESGEIAAHAGAHAGSSGAGSVVVAADQLALPRGSPGRGGGGAATP